LKNADQLLAEVMQAVDTDGNGRITYHGACPFLHDPAHTLTRYFSEFRKFVHETEKELLHLFKSIDYNRDGKISKDELRSALRTAGLAVANSNLDRFFSEVDTNNDGTISFEEWRYVLVLITVFGLWQSHMWKSQRISIALPLALRLGHTHDKSRDVAKKLRRYF
jgi:solute carrier family 25 phosphate transporter 23/24/25/41